MDLMDLIADGRAGMIESLMPVMVLRERNAQIINRDGFWQVESDNILQTVENANSIGYGAVKFMTTHQDELPSLVDAFYASLPVRDWQFPKTAQHTRNHFSEFKEFSNPDEVEIVDDFIEDMIVQYKALYQKGEYSHVQYFGNRSVGSACKVLQEYLSSYSFVSGAIANAHLRSKKAQFVNHRLWIYSDPHFSIPTPIIPAPRNLQFLNVNKNLPAPSRKKAEYKKKPYERQNVTKPVTNPLLTRLTAKVARSTMKL